MLFNSFEFIFIFLPIVVGVYFLLNHGGKYVLAKQWLLFASIFFYGWWNPKYVFLILLSIGGNYLLFLWLEKTSRQVMRKAIMLFGVSMNLAILSYYKYADFFITNVNVLTGLEFNLLHIILPLGISFFTFQQVAFIVDSYKNVVKEIAFFDYALFVTFFPQLVAGPIVHHGEMMSQFKNISNSQISYANLSKGIFVFNMGLAKKVILADTFGKIANNGYANVDLLNSFESWVTSLFYSVQLYFDFSGYSDMAIGIGLMFNIVLPNNFWSPYKSSSIKEFWRRWHMTLSRFLRDYIYIPLGGNRSRDFRTRTNLILTFLIGGIWHGAGWTFVFWGFLHGLGLVIHSFFQKLSWAMPKWMGVVITFLFINITWVFFRATSWQDAITLISRMAGLTTDSSNFVLVTQIYDLPIWIIGFALLFLPNAQEIGERFRLKYKFLWITVLLIWLNLTFLNSAINQEFLYFDF